MKQLTANELYPRDLRFGNIVNTLKGTSSVVDIMCDLINTCNGSCLYTDISGIPLDESWLVRCGFEKVYDDHVFDIGNTRIELIIWGDDEPEWKFRRILGSDIAYWKHNMPAIKHVNQLQNLYFALTGTELTINPKNEEG